MQETRQPMGPLLIVALVAAILGSVFTFGWIRYAEPTPSVAQTPLDNTAIMDSHAIERAATIIGPSVVNIDTQTAAPKNPHSQDFMKRFFGDNPPEGAPDDKEKGVGSGVIVSPDGYVLTNEHVIHGADDIKVTLTNHVHYKAHVVGADKLSDIAIVKIEANNLPAAQLGDSADVKVGQWVIAVGNPYQFEHTVTCGVISGRGRSLPDSIVKEYRDLLQTDAAINPGNSGGPLCDLGGRVIGINTAIIPYAQGIGFSIPINAAHTVMDQLIKTGHVIRPYIGITMQEVTEDAVKELKLPSAEGVLVVGIVPDSPAQKAGLMRGDVIVRIDGQKFDSLIDFQHLVRTKAVGDVGHLEYYRDGKLLKADLKVAEMPDIDKLQQMHQMYRVEFRRLQKVLSLRDDEVILERALREGLDLEYGCLGGSCGTCKVRIEGTVFQWGCALDDDEKADGDVLICCAYPRSDLVIH